MYEGAGGQGVQHSGGQGVSQLAGGQGVAHGNQASRSGHGSLMQPAYVDNEVDSWIDKLDDNRICNALNVQMGGVGANVLMASLLQQYLPKMTWKHTLPSPS